MDGLLFAIISALWLGILTSISPCPLAANIAAISFVGKRVDNPRRVMWAGLLYTVGRALAYLILGMILVNSLLTAPNLSQLLQQEMNRILGPVLIIVGMFLLELLTFGGKGGIDGARMQARAERWGIWGAGLLGMIFALSFCPVSAALFFGSLIPLGLEYQSGVVIPIVYGIGTGLPVSVFAVLIAVGAGFIGKAFTMLTKIELWMRRATGVIFILVGIYYCLVYIFKIL